MSWDIPRNHGKRWTKGLESELMNYFEKGYSSEKLANVFGRTTLSVELTVKRIRIERFLNERKIEKLIHVTDVRNLDSIQKHGILPVKTLKERGITYYYNDEDRYDAKLNGISVSITSRNDHLLKSFQRRNPRSWVELEINPLVAARRNCLFFDCNAASRKFSEIPEDQLCSFEALTKMFSGTVTSTKRVIERTNKQANKTTDDQAEIIVKWMIPKSNILRWREINV